MTDRQLADLTNPENDWFVLDHDRLEIRPIGRGGSIRIGYEVPWRDGFVDADTARADFWALLNAGVPACFVSMAMVEAYIIL